MVIQDVPLGALVTLGKSPQDFGNTGDLYLSDTSDTSVPKPTATVVSFVPL